MPEDTEDFKKRRINPAIVGIPAVAPVLSYSKEEIPPFGKHSIDDAEVDAGVDIDSGGDAAGE